MTYPFLLPPAETLQEELPVTRDRFAKGALVAFAIMLPVWVWLFWMMGVCLG